MTDIPSTPPPSERDLSSMFDPNWKADPRGARRRRSPARYLAPVVLIAVIVGTYVIVDQGLNARNEHPKVSRPVVRLTRSQRRYLHHRFYIVQANDSLTSIAAKTGVSVVRLQVLNPRIVPNTLLPGQRLRLRR